MRRAPLSVQTVRPALLAGVLFAGSMAGAPYTSAQETRDGRGNWPGLDDYDGSVGLGVRVGPDYPGSDDYTVMGLPIASVERNGYRVMTDGPGLAADLIPGKTFSLGPRIAYAPGRGDVRDDVIDRFADIDGGLDLGVKGSATMPLFFLPTSFPVFASVQGSLNQEVAGGHGGLRGGFGTGLTAVLDSVNFGLSSTVNFADSAYMDAFFSVDAADAGRSGLTRYQADAGLLSVDTSLRVTVPVYEALSITGVGTWTRMLGDAADSPVVKDRGAENGFSGIFGISYAF